ncbi:hypothetical protein EES43_13110 [Streptomyces sp. ADI96-02]|nr:hypothetical protein EES43_13110 [Streptomyces sp. ADI96-02]
MYKRMLRSVLATAFVGALAFGALVGQGTEDITWSASTPGDITWSAPASGDITWNAPASGSVSSEGLPGDITWGVTSAATVA